MQQLKEQVKLQQVLVHLRYLGHPIQGVIQQLKEQVKLQQVLVHSRYLGHPIQGGGSKVDDICLKEQGSQCGGALADVTRRRRKVAHSTRRPFFGRLQGVGNQSFRLSSEFRRVSASFAPAKVTCSWSLLRRKLATVALC
ncbi:unnamed protein product [Symbiodinium sp. CCMP2592]|nr:unnamed protein product [Symbiodinium sp. CCMP2592]